MVVSTTRGEPPPNLAGSIWLHLADLIVHNLQPAYVAVGVDGRVHACGGALETYGVSGLRLGRPACEQIYFLEGLLPAPDSPLILPEVEVGGTRFEIHLFPADGLDWILFLRRS